MSEQITFILRFQSKATDLVQSSRKVIDPTSPPQLGFHDVQIVRFRLATIGRAGFSNG